MSASTDVPVTITPGAEARIAELGMRKELEQMIAHVREVTPGLQAIEVTVAECYDSRDVPGVSIDAYSDRVYEPDDTTDRDTIRWEVETFPPQVLEHLGILFHPWNADAR
jgi:hypothetical protein